MILFALEGIGLGFLLSSLVMSISRVGKSPLPIGVSRTGAGGHWRAHYVNDNAEMPSIREHIDR